MTKRQTIFGLGLGAAVGVALTFGNLLIGQSVEMWRKVGQTIYPVPSTLATDLASTTASSMKVGQIGSRKTLVMSGMCNLHGYANTIAASTTALVDCQSGTGTLTALSPLVPAYAVGDTVFINQSTTTPSTFLGLKILGANASGTPGYIQIKILNETGATFTWSASASSSWQYYFAR